jgi:asparagine synthase (glutamine-hydrolysing)
MPGIAGIIAPEVTAADHALVQQMVAALRHRPDDATGATSIPELGICAGWVAHAGSFAARQSDASSSGALRLLWAGECFAPGQRGTPPTAPIAPDSLLSRYESEGERFVATLNGLFSGLLVDTRQRRALLFNDRYGSERLFIHEKQGVVYFASEAKALLRALPELCAFDEAGVADFLTFGSTLEGRSLFKGVQMMPGASVWRFTPGHEPARSRYFLPREWEEQAPLGDDEFEARFIEAFSRILPGYLASERALGISLTGGLDTRMIMACLPSGAAAPPCYTYAATTGDTLDVRIARRVAAMSGLAHHALRVPSTFTAEYGSHVDRTVYVTDGSAGALGAHELLLSQQAHALAPVRLTGNFGSEVLRSMSTFKPVDLDAGLVDAAWRPALARAAERAAQGHQRHPVTHAAFAEIPWHLSGTLQAGRSQLTVRTPYLDNEIVALAYRASTALRHSTHPSMRLVHENTPALARVATDRGLAWVPHWRTLPKKLFCAVTFKLDYWHKEGLPSALSATEPLFSALDAVGLLGLHKFLPYRRWFRRECAGYIGEVVADVRRRNMPFWTPSFLATAVDDHVRGRANRLRELNAILTLEAVDRLLIRGTAPESNSIEPA